MKDYEAIYVIGKNGFKETFLLTTKDAIVNEIKRRGGNVLSIQTLKRA